LKQRLDQVVGEMVEKGIRLPQTGREVERRLLESALRRCGGIRTAAARLLGIHRSTLQNKLHRPRIRDAVRRPDR
jgi:DNA-binding NtrC family response regulator